MTCEPFSNARLPAILVVCVSVAVMAIAAFLVSCWRQWIDMGLCDGHFRPLNGLKYDSISPKPPAFEQRSRRQACRLAAINDLLFSYRRVDATMNTTMERHLSKNHNTHLLRQQGNVWLYPTGIY